MHLRGTSKKLKYIKVPLLKNNRAPIKVNPAFKDALLSVLMQIRTQVRATLLRQIYRHIVGDTAIYPILESLYLLA